MKLNWLRLIVSAMLVIAALSAAAPGFAAPASHACAAMSAMDDCPDHSNHATAPRHCDSLICGAVQLTPPAALVPTTIVAVAPARRIFDDAAYRGLTAPPDLRPPIL